VWNAPWTSSSARSSGNGAPVYVRKQIVHNLHVVRALEGKGAVFVDSEDDVPEGAVCVLSAHGVSPAVHVNAARRNLSVVDATCPLVAKVHVEARRFAAGGQDHLPHRSCQPRGGQGRPRSEQDARASSESSRCSLAGCASVARSGAFVRKA